MADLGLYALRLGLLLCALGVGAGVYAGLTRREEWTRVSERSLLLVFGVCSFAMLAIFWALANTDFSLA
jgi:cytochrome c biogenesis factor